MANRLHKGDLPDGFQTGGAVALDTETMGLDPNRDRLCLVQVSTGDGNAELVQIAKGQKSAPNLCAILTDPKVLKIFHFARFDITALLHAFNALTAPVYCTKIASRLVRTYTGQHGLKALLAECLDIDVDKEAQSSDWGAETLSDTQKMYAANDVLYLHKLMEVLDGRLLREGRMDLAKSCFEFLPTRARLDILGWSNQDIFAH